MTFEEYSSYQKCIELYQSYIQTRLDLSYYKSTTLLCPSSLACAQLVQLILSEYQRKTSTQKSQRHKKNTLVLLVRQQICSRRPYQAPSGVFPPNKSAGLSARSCVTSQVHEAFLRAIFCHSRVSSQFLSGVRRQPISASPVLFLAHVVWITWLQCCTLCEHE